MPAVIVYIDDILIFMKTEQGHSEIVMEVLCRLKENDLFVKPEKCFFKVWEVEMLGLIIDPDGIKMDPKKVEVIMAWPIPTKVKEVQSFLGLANFYRHFVNNFSKVAKPLCYGHARINIYMWCVNGRTKCTYGVLRKG